LPVSIRRRSISAAIALVCASATVACGGDSGTGPGGSSFSLPIAYSFNEAGDQSARALFLTSIDGKTTRKLSGPGGDDWLPRWSPDGRQMLVWQHVNPGRLLLVDENGATVRALIDPSYGGAAWSPDGSTIAFTEVPLGGAVRLIAMHPDSSAFQPLALAAGGASLLLPSWSSTGRIAYVLNFSFGGAQIWTVNADGSQRAAFTTGANDQDPAWSPDGKVLAFAECDYQLDAPRCRLALVNADGTGRRLLVTDGVLNIRPTWSPDGKWILYEHWQSSATAGCSYVRIAPSGGTPVTIVPATATSICGGASWR